MKETKVVCPKCGAEMAIPEHESVVAGITIGKDSGLGVVTLPLASNDNKNNFQNKATMNVSKKIQAMKAAGIDVTNLFAMINAEGVETIARVENGNVTFVADDDPIVVAIFQRGTIPNRRLFRRWVMAQVFHMLAQKDYKTGKPVGFLNALQAKGFRYSWEMLIDEIRVQAKLEAHDQENFIQRNRWFNKQVASNMAEDYLKQLNDHVEKLKLKCKRCKGNPYITLSGNHIFVEDLRKKLFTPLEKYERFMKNSKNMMELFQSIIGFYRIMKEFYSPFDLVMSPAFKDAYKGAGGYFTMRNLIMFHDCRMKYSTGRVMSEKATLTALDKMATDYQNGEGWRMFGAMKELIQDNNINIEAKMLEWSSK